MAEGQRPLGERIRNIKLCFARGLELAQLSCEIEESSSGRAFSSPHHEDGKEWSAFQPISDRNATE